MQINDPSNKTRTAIVCVGYNRLKSLRRLTESLLSAEYPSGEIPLVISIDCSGNKEVYSYAENFEWPFGDKYVFIQQTRLGLKDHIYKCGDLSRYFRAIILLEDDLVVSPVFYSYVQQALDSYSSVPEIAQISLYKNEINGYTGFPFDNLRTGADVFAMQDVSTWGECWTESMWNDFRQWRDSHPEEYVLGVDMPAEIKNWTRAWSKYYNAYVRDTCRFVLYPCVSLTTNFSDAGEHGGDRNAYVQVNLQQKDFNYRMPAFNELVKYDIYFNNVDIPSWLGFTPEELCADIYGFGREPAEAKYLLSPLELKLPVRRTFAAYMRPLELNLKNKTEGKGLYLYEVTAPVSCNTKKIYNPAFPDYFLCIYSPKTILDYCIRLIKAHILRKLHLK